jgi:hypothetical protein
LWTTLIGRTRRSSSARFTLSIYAAGQDLAGILRVASPVTGGRSARLAAVAGGLCRRVAGEGEGTFQPRSWIVARTRSRPAHHRGAGGWGRLSSLRPRTEIREREMEVGPYPAPCCGEETPGLRFCAWFDVLSLARIRPFRVATYSSRVWSEAEVGVPRRLIHSCALVDHDAAGSDRSSLP